MFPGLESHWILMTRQLTAGRDKRELVMDSVLADLDFAALISSATNDPSRTTITKWVAYAYKSRVCLFEGTYRKYHTELNLMGTANKWLQEAASAADQIIKNGGFSLNTAGGPGCFLSPGVYQPHTFGQRSIAGCSCRR